MMREVKSCGFIVFSAQADSFLLLKHHHRYDLPKGHIKEGESDRECALRELEEETGLTAQDLVMDDNFSYQTIYYPRYKRFGGEQVKKTVVLFLGYLRASRKIVLGEHPAFEWVKWNPPHSLHPTLDPLLKSLADYFATQQGGRLKGGER